MSLNPEMLVLCREAAGLTQAALSNAVGVTQGRISKMESGLLGVPPDLVDGLASALDVHPGALFRPMPVRALPMTYHKKLASTGKRTLRQIHAQINIRRFEILDLLRSVPVEWDCLLPSIDVDEYGSPEDVAMAVRECLGLPFGPVANVMTTLEDAGVVLVPWLFGTREIRAISLRGANEEPHFVFYNQDLPADYLRFVLLHEAAHLVMHRIPHPGMEREADAFAGAFLLPREAISHRFPARITLEALFRMKPYWRVEAGALLMRSAQLGRVSGRRATQLWKQYAGSGYKGGGREPAPIPAEEPSLVNELVGAHREHLGYSIEELCELTKVSSRRGVELYGDGPPETPPGLRLVR